MFTDFGSRFERKSIDLLERLNACGVTIDFSKATEFSSCFGWSYISRVGIVDTRSSSDLYNLFYSCTKLVTVEKIILKDDGSQRVKNMLSACSILESVTIEGVIGQNDFSVSSSSKLTHDSLMSIINALQDKTTDTSSTTWLVTLGSTNIKKLTEEEKLLITDKGWTYK